MGGILSPIFTALLICAMVGTILVIITDDRNPSVKMIWIAVVVLVPLLGLILYFLLGLNFRRSSYTQRDHKKALAQLESQHGEVLSRLQHSEGRIAELRDEYRQLAKLLRKGQGSAIVTGDDITVYDNAQQKLEDLLEDIAKAEKYIHMEYFYFRRGEMGRRFKEALMEKARQGVKVRFIRENIANFDIRPRFYNEMKSAGVEVVRFSPSLSNLFSVATKLNYRDHRKIAIIDGRTAYTGGVNIADDYYNGWRDTHLRYRGEAVAALQVHFLDSFITSGGTIDESTETLFPTLGEPSAPTAEEGTLPFGGASSLMQIAPGDPDTSWPVLSMSYDWALTHAKDYIWLQTPYLMPPEALLQSMKAAALQGTDVRIMLPRVTDIWVTTQTNRAYYGELLRAGVRLFINQRFIHSKTMVSDDYLSCVGSANLDYRSLELSYEMNSMFYGETLAQRNKAIFLQDLENCKELTLDEWNAQPGWKKIYYDFFRLLAPVL